MAMESGKRSSFEELGSAASALRRFTRTPTGHRLSLRRSGSASISSASVKSFESEKYSSCVTRDTPSDECALHRFIVWAAVKRNASTKMTPEERRECPMLRCRKRFPNHELMLQHLYSCELLDSGEYWCYDCYRPEQLYDIKCRRCLGHPSKRKRLMSMAKSVFSSLGRPKAAHFPDTSIDEEDGPPSYFSLLETPRQFELHSNEIHEIDSSEILLPTIPEHGEVPQSDGLSRSSSMSSNCTDYDDATLATPLEPVPHAPVPLVDESLINWEPSLQVPTISSVELQTTSTVDATPKPRLQVNTALYDYHRSRSWRRSRNLVQTNSVRSTSSTTSTNSSLSNASCTISPMSAWSGAWSNSHGFNSTLTSPADDAPIPDDVFSCSQPPQSHSEVEENQLAFNHLMGNAAHVNALIELPAEVPAVLDSAAFHEKESSPSSIDTLMQLDFPSSRGESEQLVESLRHGSRQLGEHDLVQSARDTLELHIANSRTKLEPLIYDGKLALASQFHEMPPALVAAEGLSAMSDILHGGQVSSPVKLLCFAHVVYSLSLVVHEQSDPEWWITLFTQTTSYSSWLCQEDKVAYAQVVDLLWKPGDMTDEAFGDLLQTALPPVPPLNVDVKGKGHLAPQGAQIDPMILISQLFLDELEFEALKNTTRPGIQASNLCFQHLTDINLAASPESPFINGAKSLIAFLTRELHSEVSFVEAVSDLMTRIDSNHICTFRRLELELIQCGKLHLSMGVDFENYVLQIWSHTDVLRNRTGSDGRSRLEYQTLGIEMMSSVMQDPRSSVTPAHEQPLVTLKNSTKAPEEPLINVRDKTPSKILYDPDATGLFDGSLLPPVCIEPNLQQQQQQQGEPSRAGRLPSAQDMGETSEQRTQEPSCVEGDKMEADMCCDICGYRPRGHPKWFHGSMAKHKKHQHAKTPPKWHACPFPGCTSRYKNRPDNLRQHQIEKGHFVDSQDSLAKGRKRRKMA